MLVETIKSAIDDWAEHEMERAISSTRSNVSRRSDFIKSESEPEIDAAGDDDRQRKRPEHARADPHQPS